MSPQRFYGAAVVHVLLLTLTGCSTTTGHTQKANRDGLPGRSRNAPLADVNTFSIVAFDPETQEWGVGVASKYLAVGSAVPWAKAGVGAVATQAMVNVEWGPKGLDQLAAGKSAAETLAQLKADDPDFERRQAGIIDAKGETANFTGSGTQAWAGAKSGKHYSCQGNLLAGENVISAMSDAFEHAQGALAWRMQAALEAAEKAGGDRRGKQSAAILVVAEQMGPNGLGDRYIDLRVDDHEHPVQELARLLAKKLKPAQK